MPSSNVGLELGVGQRRLRARRSAASICSSSVSRAMGSSPAPARSPSRIVTGADSRVEHRTAADFGPVVILGVDPEHRHHGARRARGSPARASFIAVMRLEQREQRSAEEPGLLAGDDDDGARIGEARGRGSRCRLARRGAPAGPRARARSRPASRCARGGARSRQPRRSRSRGVAGEVRPHAIERERVVGGEASNPGEAANVDGQRRRRWTGCGVGVHRVGTVSDGYRYCQATVPTRHRRDARRESSSTNVA